MKHVKVLFGLAITCIFVAECAFADQGNAGAMDPNTPNKEIANDVRPPVMYRSLLQACRTVIPSLCPGKGAIVLCLTSKADKITDKVCKTWVDARYACKSAIDGHKYTDK
eukprot:Tbor_TRINITY_DN5865_c0_g3::TRINITY_DN5865_c0_g3_i3::g.6120::m.6120